LTQFPAPLALTTDVSDRKTSPEELPVAIVSIDV
jgi:hypothetical protein